MGATKHKEAALRAAQAARQRIMPEASRSPRQIIGRRMLLDISEAALVGFGELLDVSGDVAVSSETTLRALAGAVASLTLTLADSDDAMALRILPMMTDELRRIAEERIGAEHGLRATADVGSGESGGRP